MNFTNNYLKSKEEVLDSEGFHEILSAYILLTERRKYKSFLLLKKIFKEKENGDLTHQIIKLCKLLIIMDSREISKEFKEFENIYSYRNELRDFVEDLYTYWRNLERYAMVEDKRDNYGILNASFMSAKEAFNKLIIELYRSVSNNLSMTTPTVYRQVPAGANAGFIVYKSDWDSPKEYERLKNIPFIKEVILEAPFITYPKRNTRDGVFKELDSNPMNRLDMDENNFVCYPAMVGDLLAYVYVEVSFLTHGVSLANLFELPEETYISGKKPQLVVVFGADDKYEKKFTGFYDDRENDMVIGYVSNHQDHDYFGYMKKMILTIQNIYSLNRRRLPIHGAMVAIELKDGSKANIVIVGDSGAGKSESIEAFRALASNNISDMTIIFDDMGTFGDKDGNIWGYGTEIGAFVRLDDLETGFAFKELDRSIFMNPDKINARLITPISSYKDVVKGKKVDILLYANNYEKRNEKDSAVEIIEDIELAKKIFIEGKRMAKGTTSEEGITKSFFANPFGPHQRPEQTNELIDDYFENLYLSKVPVGVLYTQLGLKGLEKEGPKLAAQDLFDFIKLLNSEVLNETIQKN